MIKQLIIASASAIALVGCSAVETGNTGVRTSFSGKVKTQETGQGFFFHPISKLQEYSTKEIAVELMNMQPKAKDNLTLEDLDLEVYYTADASQIAELKIKYVNRDVKSYGNWLPAYDLVRSISRSQVYTTISEYDSLTIHSNRQVIEGQIMERTQTVLDKSDPGVFQITKVVIREVKTDTGIEEAIKMAVSRNKELEAKQIELEIARKQVEINDVKTDSLTPEILAEKRLEVIEKACSKGTCILSLDGGGGVTPVLNVR